MRTRKRLTTRRTIKIVNRTGPRAASVSGLKSARRTKKSTARKTKPASIVNTNQPRLFGRENIFERQESEAKMRSRIQKPESSSHNNRRRTASTDFLFFWLLNSDS